MMPPVGILKNGQTVPASIATAKTMVAGMNAQDRTTSVQNQHVDRSDRVFVDHTRRKDRGRSDSSRPTFVVVVRAAQGGNLDQRPLLRRLNRS
jgi:hypothetical protein